MKRTLFDYSKVPFISDADLAYIRQDQRLQPFYKYEPLLTSFEQVIKDKSVDDTDRTLLQKVLRDQYAKLKTDGSHADHLIDQIGRASTYTVTTAHQPVLFTGPLYVIYKAISAIKLSRILTEAYPDFNFIPVFVTGGEDHDFEEMNHCRLFGKEIIWESDQKGAVGRMSTESLQDIWQTFREILGSSSEADSIFNLFKTCHEQDYYGWAFTDLLNGLLGSHGLLVLNMDHQELKKKMIPLFRKELLHGGGSEIVRKTQEEISKAGFSPQAFVRDINLFYLGDQFRARIERREDHFEIVDRDLTFSKDELLTELEEHPERFSPNVITRPLFQETILPNLAYIGGGGEIAYWLERKAQFAHFGINFPMLIRRDSCLWVEKNVVKRLQKLDVKVEDFFLSQHEQEKQFLARKAEHEFKLGKEKGELIQLFKGIEKKAQEIDPTLRSTVAAEGKNTLKILESIEAKLRKAEKSKHEIALGQLNTVREKLFPQRGLQERKDNFLNFYLRNSEHYFEILIDAFDPFEQQFKVLHSE